MDLVTKMDGWFADRLKGLPHSPEVVAYVVGVLGKRRWDGEDLSNRSLLLTYQAATLVNDFVGFQRIGDWVLFVGSVHPSHFNGVHDFVENIGRLSYNRCFRLMGKQWRLYQELADELPSLVARVHSRLV
jgi:hypothetical protein